MACNREILTIIAIRLIACVIGDVQSQANQEYMGEKFPEQYLVPEEITPTTNDLDYYIECLRRTINQLSSSPNETEVNKSVGLFLMKVILKRTLKDDSEKIDKIRREKIAEIIKDSENVLSHYLYYFDHTVNDWEDGEYRVSRVLKFEEGHIYSIGKFNKHNLKKWILSRGEINSYVQHIDDASLSRDNYVRLAEESITNYHTSIENSDECMSRLPLNREPYNVKKLHPCRKDLFCMEKLSSSPSIAYALSHRVLNLLFYRHNRRCYFTSSKDDKYHIDILCAFAYREVVYLARRGFFARDMFMEHVTLCALMGYEEFHRRHWFHKVASWVDDEGCVAENFNYELNRTQLYILAANDEERKKLIKEQQLVLKENCHKHPTAVVVPVLAHAIRHAVHFM